MPAGAQGSGRSRGTQDRNARTRAASASAPVIALAAGKARPLTPVVPVATSSRPLASSRADPVWTLIRTRWRLKMAGTTAIMWGFFAAYFYLLNHPTHPVATMPLLAIDRWIPFQPAALILYLSLWFYVALAPALLTSRRELWSYAAATIAMGAIGLGIFRRWPTAVPVSYLDHAGPGVDLLRGVDAAGNACPSLHVAFAVFTALWFGRIFRGRGAGAGWRWGNVLWGAGIVYSTLAVKQHVMLDVIPGALLGAGMAWAHFVWLGAGGVRGRPPEPGR